MKTLRTGLITGMGNDAFPPGRLILASVHPCGLPVATPVVFQGTAEGLIFACSSTPPQPGDYCT